MNCLSYQIMHIHYYDNITLQGRLKARAKKMQLIAHLLEIPGQNHSSNSNSISAHGNSRLSLGLRNNRDHSPLFATPSRVPGFAAALRRDSLPGSVSRIQLAVRQSSLICGGIATDTVYYTNEVSNRQNCNSPTSTNSRDSSPQRNSPSREGPHSKHHSKHRTKSRDSSPKIPRPRSEEIPLEEMRLSQSPGSIPSTSGMVEARPQTPKTLENNIQVVENKPKDVKSEETSFIAKRKGMVETV